MECKEGRGVKIKGSGSSFCLLNQEGKDQKAWLVMELDFRIKRLEMSGSFIMSTSSQNQLYLWGTLRQQIIKKPLMIKKQVDLISCGWDHALVYSQINVFGLGNNSYKELGIHTEKSYLHNLITLLQKPVRSLLAGFRQSYVVSDNSLLGCGESKKYELGISTPKGLQWKIICENLSEKIKGNVMKIRCTKRCLFLLNDKGQLYVLGCNEQNCCNKPESGYFIEPTLIIQDVFDFSCGWGHLVIINSKRQVKSYGRNNLGQLGHENESQIVEMELKQGQFIEQVTCGSQFTFARSNKRHLYTWGWNQHFNLLNQHKKVITTPLLIEQNCTKIWTYPAITLMQQQQ